MGGRVQGEYTWGAERHKLDLYQGFQEVDEQADTTRIRRCSESFALPMAVLVLAIFMMIFPSTEYTSTTAPFIVWQPIDYLNQMYYVSLPPITAPILPDQTLPVAKVQEQMVAGFREEMLEISLDLGMWSITSEARLEDRGFPPVDALSQKNAQEMVDTLWTLCGEYILLHDDTLQSAGRHGFTTLLYRAGRKLLSIYALFFVFIVYNRPGNKFSGSRRKLILFTLRLVLSHAIIQWVRNSSDNFISSKVQKGAEGSASGL